MSSSPSRRTDPDTSACGGNSPITAIADADLPEPDSPTTATTSPASTRRFSPRTAVTSSASVANVTARSVTSSRLMAVSSSRKRSSAFGPPSRLAAVRVQRVAQAVADQVGAQHDQHQNTGGKQEYPRERRRRVGAIRDQRAQRDVGRLHAESEEAQAGFGQN